MIHRLGQSLVRSSAKFVQRPSVMLGSVGMEAPRRWLSIDQAPTESMSEMQQEYAKEISDIMESYEERKKRKQSLVGVITSTKCAKSITVQVEHEKYYPKYNKSVKSRKKVMAHDEEGRGQVGDVVRVVPCRPMSKKKRHALIDIVKAAEN